MIIFKRLTVVTTLTMGLLILLLLLFEVNPAGADQTKPPFWRPDSGHLAQGITPTTVITLPKWVVHFSYTHTDALNGLDCPTADFCVGVGVTGTIYSWNGQEWTLEPSPTTSPFNQVSCVTASWCKATSVGSIWFWDGEHWTADEIPAGYEAFSFGMECVNEQFCLAYGKITPYYPFEPAVILGWDGSSWTQVQIPAAYVMDCASPTYCKLVSQMTLTQYYFFITGWNGITSTMETFPTPYFISDIECLSEQFCKAVWGTSFDPIFNWDGVEWRSESLSPTLPITDTPFSIACSSETSCKTVSRSGHIVSWDGVDWVLEGDLSLASRLSRGTVVCPTSTNCYGYADYARQTSGQPRHGVVFGMYSQILQDVSEGFMLEMSEEPTCLTGVTITQHEENHPEAPAGMQTGRYWSVDAPCTDSLRANLTLPSPITPTAEMQICYQNEPDGLWQCRQDGFTAETITVNNLTALSDWFIGVPDPALTHTIYLPIVVTE